MRLWIATQNAFPDKAVYHHKANDFLLQALNEHQQNGGSDEDGKSFSPHLSAADEVL